MVRFKNRYLLVEILYPETQQPYPPSPEYTQRYLTNTIRTSLSTHFGEYAVGITASSFAVKYFSPYTHLGIIRVNRDHFRSLWASLTFITSLRTVPCTFKVIHVGGTISQCQKTAIAYDRDLLLKLKRDMSSSGKLDLVDISQLVETSEKEISALEA